MEELDNQDRSEEVLTELLDVKIQLNLKQKRKSIIGRNERVRTDLNWEIKTLLIFTI